jgi:hypothetical protein
MPTVEVIDLNHVNVDGAPGGALTDVLENYKGVVGIRGAVLGGLRALIDATAQAHAAALAELKAEHVAALAEKDKAIADLDAQVKALGGTDLAQQLAREKRTADLLAQKQRIDDELAGIDAAAAAPQPEGTPG